MASKYARLESEDFEDEAPGNLLPTSTAFLNRTARQKPARNMPKTKSMWTYFRSVKDIVIYLFAAWGLITLLRRIESAPFHQVNEINHEAEFLRGCDCGDSIKEAKSLGCKFDSLSMAWLPEHCRDDELTAEFNTMGNGPNGTWVYYADTLHSKEVDVAEVAAMGDDTSARVHMNKDWHMVHCLYYWRKQFRTRDNGKIVEPRSDTEDHIKHCGMVIMGSSYGTISGVALNTNEVAEE